MGNSVSLFSGHDANVTFYNEENDSYHIIELERMLKKRYFRLHFDNDDPTMHMILSECQSIAERYWGFTNDYDVLCFSSLTVKADSLEGMYKRSFG